MSPEHRKEQRFTVTVAGRYRPRHGGSREIWIKDISEYGCQFFDRFSALAVGTSISVRIGNIGPIPADVKWRRGHFVGAEFDKPLHPGVRDHIVREMDKADD